MLSLKEDSVVVDATLGGGGHAREILKKIKNGKLIAIDADEKAVKNFQNEKDERVVLINNNFSNLDSILENLKIEKVDAILADLGWSSDQLIGKGMSFQKDELLDMRLNNKEGISAKDIVNDYSEEELGRILREYGEEKFWKNITKKIVEYRKKKKIETTVELAEIIKNAAPAKYRHGKLNPATRTFQALRIAVNNELENLEKFLKQAIERLNPRGRLAVISFHSLEDRIVKNIFRQNARGSFLTDELTGQKITEKNPTVSLITKKPVISSKEETENNPRARSAKLRVCERI